MQSKAFKILLPVAVVLVAVAITMVLVKTRPQAQRQTPPTPQPRVTVMTIGDDPSPVKIRGFGSVKAKRSVMLVPQVSGEVEVKSSDFESGGFFSEGQVLLSIDDTDYRLAVARAEADVAQAEVNLAMAQEEAQSARLEWAEIGSRNGSGEVAQPSPLVLREPQLKLAEAGLEAARAALRQAQVNLGRCTISAPFDGRVLTADTDVGQYLRSGTSIGAIYATDVAEISVPVADEDLAWINLSTDANQASTVTVAADFAGATHTWTGRAVRLGGAVDARSRLVPVVVEVDRPYEKSGSRPPLVEGMFVEVTFSNQATGDAVVIPRTALRPGNEVWVVNSENHIRIVPVTVARAGIEEALISSGLQPGLQLVTSNLQFVTPDMKVQIEGQAPEGETPQPENKGGK